jgi:hypothetical protein
MENRYNTVRRDEVDNFERRFLSFSDPRIGKTVGSFLFECAKYKYPTCEGRDVTPCGLLNRYRGFEGKFALPSSG